MLKLKLQYFGHLMWRTDSSEKTLMLGKVEGGGRRDDTAWDSWMASLTRWIWVWADSGSWWWTGKPGVLQSTGLQRVKHDWVTELKWAPQGKRESKSSQLLEHAVQNIRLLCLKIAGVYLPCEHICKHIFIIHIRCSVFLISKDWSNKLKKNAFSSWRICTNVKKQALKLQQPPGKCKFTLGLCYYHKYHTTGNH